MTELGGQLTAEIDALAAHITERRLLPVIGPAMCPELPQDSEHLTQILRTRGARDGLHVPEIVLGLRNVAQYIAAHRNDNAAPRRWVAEYVVAEQTKIDSNWGGAYRAISELPISTYVTTNFDQGLESLLAARSLQKFQDIGLAHYWGYDGPREASDSDARNPDDLMVYHLWGHAAQPRSIVVSDDDVVDFAAYTAQTDHGGLPSQVRFGLAYSTLLFLGYQPADWELRLTIRSLLKWAGVDRTQMIPSVAIVVDPQSLGDLASDWALNHYINGRVTIYVEEPLTFVESLQRAAPGRS